MLKTPRHVLIYAPLAVLGHHFETDLEIIQNHLDALADATRDMIRQDEEEQRDWPKEREDD